MFNLKNAKIITKIARFFAIVSIVFVIYSALVTFYLLQITSPTAPIAYDVAVILSSIVPYLFIAALSLVITMVAGNVETESPEKEVLSSGQPEVVNA